MSADSMGPVIARRRPRDAFTTVSIASAEAAPSAHSAQASRRIAYWSRLPMKPGTSLSTITGSFPTARSTPQSHGATSGSVSGPAQTSTRGMSCGGYQKWAASTRPRCVTFDTSSLAGCPLPEARTAGGAQIASSRPYTSSWTARSAGTASRTSCATAASSSSVEVRMRPRAALASPDVTSPCASKAARLFAILSIAAARLASRRPIMTTLWPAVAKICAIP